MLWWNCILYRSNLNVLFSRKLELYKSEIVTCTITNKSNSIAKIIIIYRPPSLSFTNFITDLYDFVVPLFTLNTIILGDFNINVNKTESRDATTFYKFIKNNMLLLHIAFPTHIHGNILDLIITRKESTLINNYNC